MTIEQAQRDYDELIAKNGFILVGRTSDTDNPIYHRVWKKTVQVAWHGEQEETLEARILLSYGYPLVTIKRNGGQDPKFTRDYSSPKRAMNAIRGIVKFAGFEW